MNVEDKVVPLRLNHPAQFQQPGKSAIGRKRDDLVEMRIVPNEIRVIVFDQEVQLHLRKRSMECADERGREDDVADGTKADD